jgi:hypothetical protein
MGFWTFSTLSMASLKPVGLRSWKFHKMSEKGLRNLSVPLFRMLLGKEMN